jgi:RNA polymerase sigma-70 factor (ECF subfamily)
LKDHSETLLELLQTHGAGLHALLTRVTLREEVAEDLMQELFIKLARSRGFAKADNKAAYARRSAMHLAFDWRRSRNRRPPATEMRGNPPSADPSPLSRLMEKEQLKRILNAAGEIPPLYRDAFVMRYIQQESFETVGEQLGKTPHQVRGLCHKAVVKIRSLLNNRPAVTEPKEQSHVRD